MNIKYQKIIDLINDKNYNILFDKLDELLIEQNIFDSRVYFVLNSILFKDCEICLEYIISEHKTIFFKNFDYIKDKAMNVYFSDKCLDLLLNLEKREDLFI